jgi:outer membrane receptor protein involved in Fe transport
MFQRLCHVRSDRFSSNPREWKSVGRAAALASASIVALMGSDPLLAQAASRSAQVPAGPTGAAQDIKGANPATAATPQSSADASTPSNSNEIVVTGTRVAGRSRLDTASPVDVLSANSLQHQGTTELGTAIAAVAPSVDFPRPSATDATDAIRPATLRGLSPDETLVLINNVRAHPSASLNINGSVGRGSSAVDLNTVPTAALDRVEVLRDGASALYGSDALGRQRIGHPRRLRHRSRHLARQASRVGRTDHHDRRVEGDRLRR